MPGWWWARMRPKERGRSMSVFRVTRETKTIQLFGGKLFRLVANFVAVCHTAQGAWWLTIVTKRVHSSSCVCVLNPSSLSLLPPPRPSSPSRFPLSRRSREIGRPIDSLFSLVKPTATFHPRWKGSIRESRVWDKILKNISWKYSYTEGRGNIQRRVCVKWWG